jgi:hypothetical protein
MKKILLILLLSSALTANAQFKNYFLEKTLRIDYIHSGNNKSESFKMDQLIEKKNWAGSNINLIDTFNYGKYMVEVYDNSSLKMIYSRGYSSLFAEWRTTAEGKLIEKSFSETVLIPYPKKTINIVFKSRDTLNIWHDADTIIFNPAKDNIIKPKKNNNKIVKLHYSGDYKTKLDIAIIADGYAATDSIKMKEDLKRFASYILNASPFDNNKGKINIWGVAAISKESGITDPILKTFKNTAIGTSFNTIGSDRYLMTLENKTLHDQLSDVVYDQIVIMVNTEKYGGGGIYNFYSTAAAGDSRADFLLQHEFGHAFAGLGDEYYSSEVSVENFYPLTVEPWEPNITTLVLFGKKWKNLIAKKTPVPTPVNKEFEKTVGVFEGGGYMAKGIYRPFTDCTMKSIIYNYYCPVCTRAVKEMIDFYAK